MTRVRVLSLCAAVVAGLLGLAQLPAPPRPTLAARNVLPISSIKAWGYQLQGARSELIPPEIDLLVIDHARDASDRHFFSATDVEDFRRRAGPRSRIVLAYMSIGEAETYRSYWRPSWTSSGLGALMRPGWLGLENKEWRGNYLVRYWQSGWQNLIVAPNRSRLDALRQDHFGADLPYIDKILEAGFDGVYLDRVDAFAPWEKTHPTAQAEMRAFVARISAYAKARRPGFLIVPQNGEELTQHPGYLKVIDAIAKEDLVFGLDGTEHENPVDEIAHATETLNKVAKAGLPVLSVEYVADPDKQQSALRHLRAQNFLPTFATRDLNTPPALPPSVRPAIAPTQR